MDEYDDQWIEDILYYEGPLLALFRDNKTGQLSLHYWCGVVEDKYNKWMAFNVTDRQLNDYKSGKLSLTEVAVLQPTVRMYLLDEDLNTVFTEVKPVCDFAKSDMPPAESFYDPDLAPSHYYND